VAQDSGVFWRQYFLAQNNVGAGRPAQTVLSSLRLRVGRDRYQKPHEKQRYDAGNKPAYKTHSILMFHNLDSPPDTGCCKPVSIGSDRTLHQNSLCFANQLFFTLGIYQGL